MTERRPLATVEPCADESAPREPPSMDDRSAVPDPFPTLLVCGFGPFPAAPANPAHRVIEALEARNWRPAGASIAYAVLPTVWDHAAETVQAAAADSGANAVLLVGVAVRAQAFRVELRARNRTASDRPDATGAVLGRDRIDLDGPVGLRVTAPADAMLEALRAQHLPAEPSSDAGAYLCNFTLYRVLRRADPPSAGFLHVPQARELAGPGAASNLTTIDLAVRTAAHAYADVLARNAALAPV